LNLYILVEDAKSGKEIVEKWIGLICPKLKRVNTVGELTYNSYIVFSGHGYPSMLGINPESKPKNILGETIETINETGIIDFFLVFVDGDEAGVTKRIASVVKKINLYPTGLICPYAVFVQNKCLETWLLGNTDLLSKNPIDEIVNFLNHYDIFENDPELMKKDKRYATTDSLYHERYLREMMKYAGHRYNKAKAAPIMLTNEYINGLKNRLEKTDHLLSLRTFFEFMDFINDQT